MPVVHRAALTAMKELGLTLSEDRADTLEFMRESRTRATVRVGRTGDEIRSRKILDTIKQYLPPASGGSRPAAEKGSVDLLASLFPSTKR